MITYPRALPSELIISASKFKPMYQTLAPRRTRGGELLTTEFGEPYWECEIKMNNTSPSRAVAIEAWKNSLQGGQKTFLAHHHPRPRPSAYPTDASVLALTRSGGGAFSGTAVVTSFPTVWQIGVSASSSSRLPASFQLKTGDMIGITKFGSANKYFLHQVMQDVTAAADGAVVIDVEPRVLINLFGVGDTISFLKPVAEFKMLETQGGMVSWEGNEVMIQGSSVVG